MTLLWSSSLGFFLMALHDSLLCSCVQKVKMPGWVTFLFHFIYKAQSAGWSLIHSGNLKAEVMTDYLEWRNVQVFIELELENTVQWRESGLLNLPDHISPGFIPWLEHCRNCRTFSLRASNLLGLSWDQELPAAAQCKLLYFLCCY